MKSQAEKEAAMMNKSEPEEFELRKKPLDSSPNYASSPSQVAMPRAVLLSNPQLSHSQLTSRPRLYDEDEINSEHGDLVKEDKLDSENSNTLPC